MNLTDEIIYSVIGDIDTSKEVTPHISEDAVTMKDIIKGIAAEFDNEEDFLAELGEMFAPLREHLGGTDVDDELSRAFEAADRRNNPLNI